MPLRRAAVEKLRDGGDKLGRRERLLKHDAVGDALGGPISGAIAAHLDDREFGCDLTGVLSDFPTVHSAPQIDVGHERAILASISL